MIIAIFFLSFFGFQVFGCDHAVNPNKVVLFVDTNSSTVERETAARAACARGESFVQIPRPTPQAVRALQYENQYTRLITQFNHTCLPWREENAGRCRPLDAQFRAAYAQEEAVKRTIPPVNAQTLDAAIRALAGSNKAITSVVMSGHDGGGFVEGVTGEVSKTDFFHSMHRYYGHKPELLRQFNSALLWGCYTSTPQEIGEWKASFPDLQLIAGFNGKSPSNMTAATSTILNDLLLRAGQIEGARNAAELSRMLRSISNINVTNAGIYTRACNEDFYYNTDHTGTHFSTLAQARDCRNLPTQNYLRDFNRYFRGNVEVNDEDMRRIYDFAREHDHCFPSNHPLDGDRVALLLFFQSVKENFGRVFAPLIGRAANELNSLSAEVTRLRGANEGHWWDYLTGSSASKHANLQAIAEFERTLNEVRHNFFIPNEHNLTYKTRADILHNIAVLEPLIRNPLVSSTPELRARMGSLIDLQHKMQNYLYQLRPSCMDFLEWHEVIPGRMPHPRC